MRVYTPNHITKSSANCAIKTPQSNGKNHIGHTANKLHFFGCFFRTIFSICYAIRAVGVVALAIVALLSFSGCSGNFVQMQYLSSKENNYLFNPNAPTIVAYQKGDLLAASYVPFVMEILSQKGFTSLYAQGQLSRKKARNIVFISLTKLTKTTPTASVSYMPSKMIDQSSCVNYDGMYYCREETYPIITDYSASLEVSSGYHFIMDWYDLPTKKRIFYIDGSIEDSPCIFEGIYKDLIYQTISRIDVSRGELYSYPTTLSYYDATCLLAQTKKLGVKR